MKRNAVRLKGFGVWKYNFSICGDYHKTFAFLFARVKR